MPILARADINFMHKNGNYGQTAVHGDRSVVALKDKNQG